MRTRKFSDEFKISLAKNKKNYASDIDSDMAVSKSPISDQVIAVGDVDLIILFNGLSLNATNVYFLKISSCEAGWLFNLLCPPWTRSALTRVTTFLNLRSMGGK